MIKYFLFTGVYFKINIKVNGNKHIHILEDDPRFVDAANDKSLF